MKAQTRHKMARMLGIKQSVSKMQAPKGRASVVCTQGGTKNEYRLKEWELKRPRTIRESVRTRVKTEES